MGGSLSLRISAPPSAANSDSAERMIAALAGGTCCWPMACRLNATAVENTPDGRVIAATQLEISGTAEYATITVTDNGPGFAREVLGRVFDPYVTSKPKGTGLGLAIVKKIVEEHGGRVEADNRPEGGGRVRVSLPVTDGSRQMVARERRVEPRKERA